MWHHLIVINKNYNPRLCEVSKLNHLHSLVLGQHQLAPWLLCHELNHPKPRQQIVSIFWVFLLSLLNFRDCKIHLVFSQTLQVRVQSCAKGVCVSVPPPNAREISEVTPNSHQGQMTNQRNLLEQKPACTQDSSTVCSIISLLMFKACCWQTPESLIGPLRTQKRENLWLIMGRIFCQSSSVKLWHWFTNLNPRFYSTTYRLQSLNVGCI